MLSSIKIGCFFSFIVGVYSKEKKAKERYKQEKGLQALEDLFSSFLFSLFLFISLPPADKIMSSLSISRFMIFFYN